MDKRQRDRQLKAVVAELKAHLKKTSGDPREDAAAYFSPKCVRAAPRKRSRKKRARRG